MNREMKIRKEVLDIYNKRREDFSELKDYNDYLEEVEDIVFSLTEGRDASATRAKMAAYARSNVDTIAANKSRKAEEVQRAQRAAAAAEAASSATPASGLAPVPMDTSLAADTARRMSGLYTPGMGLLAPPSAVPRSAPPLSQPRRLDAVAGGGLASGLRPGGSGAGTGAGTPADAAARAAVRAAAGGWLPQIAIRRALAEGFGSLFR